MKLRYKMMLCMAVLMLLTLGIYIVSSTAHVQDELFGITVQTMNSTVRANAEKLSSSLGQMSSQIITLANSVELREGLKAYEEKSLVDKWESWRRINSLFQIWSYYSPYQRVYLHLHESTLFFRNSPYYMPGTEGIAAYSAYSSDFGQQYWTINEEDGSCSCFMPVVPGMKSVGYVELAIGIEWFDSVTDLVDEAELSTYIVDTAGKVLSGSRAGQTLSPGQLQLAGQLSADDVRKAAAADQTLYLYESVASTPFHVVCELNGGMLSSNGDRVAGRLLLIGVMILPLSLLMALGMSRVVTRKLTLLTNEIERIKGGNLDLDTNRTVRDELDQTLYDFAIMAQQLKKMMEDVRIAEQRRKESDLRLLQAQINPHFIANALSCADSLALNHDVAKAHDLIKSISNYLRLSLHKSWQDVPLERELALVDTYWQIQHARFGDRLALSVKISPGLLAASIPPLTVQTLVENTMMHAFRSDRRESCSVEIRVHEMERILVIEVEDNGSGMDAQRLEQVRRALEDDQVSSCYGLWNVNKRIAERFGPEFGLSMESVEGQGTLCILTLPLQ